MACLDELIEGEIITGGFGQIIPGSTSYIDISPNDQHAIDRTKYIKEQSARAEENIHRDAA